MTCNYCGRPTPVDPITCNCEKYGYAGHEDTIWCCDHCMWHDHPEYDVDPPDDSHPG